MHEEDVARRIGCSNIFRELGINPYPTKISLHGQDFFSNTLLPENLLSLDEIKDSHDNYFVAWGRIVLFRCMGKNTFLTIQNQHQKAQIMVNRDCVHLKGTPIDSTLSSYKLITKHIDIGDIIVAQGPIFATKKGETTILARNIEIICKSILPLPDKVKGIKDTNTIYRKRWLDLISNQDSFNKFKARSSIIKSIRDFMEEHSFMEVETPTLQNIYGGAQAQPFITHSNDMKIPLFLRIALELPLKELVVGGFNRIFEIGKVFRNESVDRTHNPEFTSLEAYAANWDYEDVMSFVSKMIESVVVKIYGTTKIHIPHIKTKELHEVDFAYPWKKLSLVQAVSDTLSMDVSSASVEAILHEINQQKIIIDDYASKTKGELILAIFEEVCEDKIIQPTHIYDYPLESTPLCKKSETQNIKDVEIIERFETFALGMEICNAYSELNDPVLQKELMYKSSQINKNKDEHNPVDKLFLSAIDQGMPPSGGFGIGIDRVVMLLTSSDKISDIIFFPMMKTIE